MVHVILPGDIDDPRHPSGGNVYDREVARGLGRLGWPVHEHPVSGGWPHPAPGERDRLAAVLAQAPVDALVLVDGLVASAAPAEMAAEGRRLRLVVLAHMVAADVPAAGPPTPSREYAALEAASAVVTTSRWTRDRLRDLHGLPGTPIHVVEPGVDRADLAEGTSTGGQLLSVGAVTPAKGDEVLLDALGSVRDLPWRWVRVGRPEPGLAGNLRRRAEELDVADRVSFTGPLTGGALSAAYARADLLVHPSRAEAYGLVVTEALARGLPVVASDVGGVPQALGRTACGVVPGALVPPGDVGALAAVLRRWLEDTDHRQRLRAAARERRPALSPWAETSSRMAQVLNEVADEPRAALSGT